MSRLHLNIQCHEKWESKCTMKWGTSASGGYFRCWGVPDLEWDVHNESQFAKVGFIEIQNVILNRIADLSWTWASNHRPGHTQQQRKAELHHEYPSCVTVSNTLGYRSEVCPNNSVNPAQPVPWPRIRDPVPHILTQDLSNRVDCVDCWMGLAIMQWRSWWYVFRTIWCIWTLIICQQ